MASRIKNRSMFGTDVQYLMVLAMLAWMTFSLPEIQMAIFG